MEPQLLILFAVGTLLVLNGVLGRAGFLGMEDDAPAPIVEEAAAHEQSVPPA